VRAKAAESLDILLICRKDCFKDLLQSADELIKELKKRQFKPGTANCQLVYQLGGSGCGIAAGVPATQKAVIVSENIPRPSAPPTERGVPGAAAPGISWAVK